MKTDPRATLMEGYRDGLLCDTLPFWFPRCVDVEHGGYFTAFDRQGSRVDDDKSIWFQGRGAWLLGKFYNTVERRADWLEWCRAGIEFLDRHGFDPADGRMWFQVTADARPIRKRRYAFSEAFAAIAYGEYARATANDTYAAKARRCFDRFVTHVGEPKFTGTRVLRGLSQPMITIVTAQELRESIELECANAWIDRSVETIVRDHLKPEVEAVVETVGARGELLDHFDGRLLNPGHALEAAWFILREGRRRDDSQLIRTGLTMLDWMWRRGWDTEYGGMLYYVDLFHKPIQEYWHDMKFCWPHNETIIATLLAHEITGDERYARWNQQVREWAYAHFADPEFGEWYGYLHRDGSVSSRLKGGLWKGPFHLPRMQWFCWQLLKG
ncbi:MAG: AGE family epimerase/isomerase [Verrucomicrobia bacterium]|nr:AGE family epimerase/isomerase [Verrucomicrobiota bacterium]